MGIDVYLRWKGQTKEEKEAQYTGFSIHHGHVGYLREAYHGEPYATIFLAKEAADSPNSEARIKAAILKKRLPQTLKLAKRRSLKIYGSTIDDDDKSLQAFRDFVALAASKEEELKEPCTIVFSG